MAVITSLSHQQMPNKRVRSIANALYLLGVLLAVLLATATAWGDYEGLSYFATGASFDPFSGLDCPILITRQETGVVSADFQNPNGKAVQPYYEIEISGVTASRQLEGQLTLGPHASQRLTWTVDARDVDLGMFVMVKLDVLPVAGHGTREATCGILIAGLPGPWSGDRWMMAALALAVLLMLAGMILPAMRMSSIERARFDNEASANPRRAMQALGITSASAMLTALAGWWLGGLLLSAISLLLLLIVLAYLTA